MCLSVSVYVIYLPPLLEMAINPSLMKTLIPAHAAGGVAEGGLGMAETIPGNHEASGSSKPA